MTWLDPNTVPTVTVICLPAVAAMTQAPAPALDRRDPAWAAALRAHGTVRPQEAFQPGEGGASSWKKGAEGEGLSNSSRWNLLPDPVGPNEIAAFRQADPGFAQSTAGACISASVKRCCSSITRPPSSRLIALNSALAGSRGRGIGTVTSRLMRPGR